MPDQPWDDCCDHCAFIDGDRDRLPCSNMAGRCKGDSCDTCKRCFAFRPGESFRPAMQLLRRRPEVPKTDIKPQIPAKGRGRRLTSYGLVDRPTGRVGP